jgi:hypothetical protein
MLSFLADRLSPRKRQLFACACVRRVWHLVGDSTCRRAVEVAERYADGRATEDELRRADEATVEGDDLSRPYGPAELAATLTLLAHEGFGQLGPGLHDPAASAAAYAARAAGDDGAAARAQADLLRDIAGNPFRPVTLDSSCRAPPVVALARSIYDGRAFSRLPELARALGGAGCPAPGPLDHLRSGGEHVRGCWALDLVLGKE